MWLFVVLSFWNISIFQLPKSLRKSFSYFHCTNCPFMLGISATTWFGSTVLAARPVSVTFSASKAEEPKKNNRHYQSLFYSILICHIITPLLIFLDKYSNQFEVLKTKVFEGKNDSVVSKLFVPLHLTILWAATSLSECTSNNTLWNNKSRDVGRILGSRWRHLCRKSWRQNIDDWQDA